MLRRIFSLVVSLAAGSLALSSDNAVSAAGKDYTSQYSGQEKRAIKSLSQEDIEELRAGAGWGLAKAAELNGLPGPKHILEMKEEVELSSDQERKIAALFKAMNEEARGLGKKLIFYEKELNDRFAERNIDEQMLAELLDRITDTYKALRYTHLSAHLRTPDILTEDQIEKYNKLRGYSSHDPCANIPEGHDPVMWRKHNNCD